MATTPTPKPLTTESTLDEILHGLIAASLIAASIFVKNPKSQATAASLTNLVTQDLLPILDGLLASK